MQKLHVEIKPATGCSSRSAVVIIAKHQLAALVFGAYRVPERERVAAFLSDPATHLTSNPFAATCVATARHVWTGRADDWRVTDIETTGLTELVSALTDLPAAEPLSEEIARSGAIAASVILTADRARLVGVVIYGKAGCHFRASSLAARVAAWSLQRSSTCLPVTVKGRRT